MHNQKTKIVDPDPFVVAGTIAAVGSALLQMVQIYLISRKPPDPEELSKSMRRQGDSLDHLEDYLTSTLRAIERLKRAVERGTEKPREQFFKRKFRVSLGPLLLDYESAKYYGDQLGQLVQQLNLISSRTHSICSHDPALAQALGQELVELLNTEMPAQNLNAAISDGDIGDVITECEAIIEAFDKALGQLRKLKN